MKNDKPLHDIELEKALIGYLIAHQSSFAAVRPIIKRLGYFTSEAHRAIYAAMLDLDENDWDEVVIGNHLKKSGKLGMAGEHKYLAELSMIAPSSANVAYYAKLLKESYLGKMASSYAKELHLKINKSPKNDAEACSIHDAVSETIKKLQGLQASLGARKNKVRAVSEIMPEIWTQMEEIEKTGVNPALSTRFNALDRVLGGGFCRAEFNILAARPSVGKTSFALNVANSCSPGIKILFISLETTSESIARDRLIPMVAGVPSGNVRVPKTLTQNDWDKLGGAVHAFSAYKDFKICDQSAMTIEDIEVLVAAENGSKGGGLDFLIIDYMQLIRTAQKMNHREERVSEISQRLKAMIKEHNLFSLVLAQLNRESEKNNRAPRLSDLRESGQIEQDADTIILFHRDKDSTKPLAANVAKNKNGPQGDVEFDFNKRLTLFECREQQSDF